MFDEEQKAELRKIGIYPKEELLKSRNKLQPSGSQVDKWESLAQHCFKLSGSYFYDHLLRDRKSPQIVIDKCQLCDPSVKTASMQFLKKHKCLSDDLIVPLEKLDTKNGPIVGDRVSKGRKKPAVVHEARKIESALLMEKNVRTLGKVIAMDGPAALDQLFSCTPFVKAPGFDMHRYSGQLKVIDAMLKSGYMDYLDQLADEMEIERKQKERRTLLARRTIRAPLKRNDFDQIEDSSTKAIVTTPVRSSSIQDILPLSTSKAAKLELKNINSSTVKCYRKALWQDRYAVNSPIKNLTSELRNLPSNVFSGTPVKDPCLSCDEQKTSADSYGSERVPYTTQSKFDKTEENNCKNISHFDKPPSRKTRRMEKTPVRESCRRKVKFNIAETPDNHNQASKKENLKYKPRFSNLNSGLIPKSSFGNTQLAFKFPSFLIQKLLSEKSFGVRSLESLTKFGAIKCIEAKQITEEVDCSFDLDDLLSKGQPAKALSSNASAGSENSTSQSPPPPLLNNIAVDHSDIYISKNSPLNLSPCGVLLNCVKSESAFHDVSSSTILSPNEKGDLLFGSPKVNLSTILTRSPSVKKSKEPEIPANISQQGIEIRENVTEFRGIGKFESQNCSPSPQKSVRGFKHGEMHEGVNRCEEISKKKFPTFCNIEFPLKCTSKSNRISELDLILHSEKGPNNNSCDLTFGNKRKVVKAKEDAKKQRSTRSDSSSPIKTPRRKRPLRLSSNSKSGDELMETNSSSDSGSPDSVRKSNRKKLKCGNYLNGIELDANSNYCNFGFDKNK